MSLSSHLEDKSSPVRALSARDVSERALGRQRRRIFDSSRTPASDVVDRLPGIFEDYDLVGPEDDALYAMARPGTPTLKSDCYPQVGTSLGPLLDG